MTTTDMDRAIGAAADFPDIAAAIAQAPNLATEFAVLALETVCRGVMTGEGPTTRGRAHFSRTIDGADAALCEKILIAGGRSGRPVTRAEAEVLLDIHAAGREREDGGHFDGLLVKAIAHHVLAAAGHPVPPRAVALDRATDIADWTTPRGGIAIDRGSAGWLDRRIGHNRHDGGPFGTLAALLMGADTVPAVNSLTALSDFAA